MYKDSVTVPRIHESYGEKNCQETVADNDNDNVNSKIKHEWNEAQKNIYVYEQFLLSLAFHGSKGCVLNHYGIR